MSAISSSTYAASTAANSSSAPATRPMPARDYLVSQATKVAEFFKANPLAVTGIAALINAGAGALAAGLFTAVSPLGGALYGFTDVAASALLGRAIEWICEKTGYQPEHTIMKVAVKALPMIAGIAAGCAAASLAGFVLTPGTVVALGLGTVGLGIAGGVAAACAGFGLALGAALHDVYNNPQSNPSTTATRA